MNTNRGAVQRCVLNVIDTNYSLRGSVVIAFLAECDMEQGKYGMYLALSPLSTSPFYRKANIAAWKITSAAGGFGVI